MRSYIVKSPKIPKNTDRIESGASAKSVPLTVTSTSSVTITSISSEKKV
jgi:hypothetical protein